MIKKVFISIVLIFSFSIINAQNKTADTNLDELVIVSKKKKKIKKHKITGVPAFNSIEYNESIVTRIENLPKGKISSVSFYFNTLIVDFVDFVMGKKFETNYLDVELGLLVYEVLDDKYLGNMSSDCEIKFVVPYNHKGAFKVNLSNLDLPKENFFIGFKVLSQTNKDENNIYLRLFEDDKYVSYFQSFIENNTDLENKTNSQFLNSAHLKMTFEIEQ